MWIKYGKQLVNINNSFNMYMMEDKIKIYSIDGHSYGEIYFPNLDVNVEKVFDAITHCITQNKTLFDIDEFLKTGFII